MRLLDKVMQTARQYKLIEKQDNILIGVSGGPDSIALLYVLLALEKEFKLNLHIAHLNHMLRAKESQADADFVLGLANKFNIPATLKEVDVAKSARRASLEEEARKARLGFLFYVARKIKADKIALGHNRDDQSETVLMRILRGSGLLGLAGILPKREIEGFTIIRPLIEIPRKDIERFLRLKNIKPRRDSSNLDEIHFRNRIRHKLLPELERYNPNIRQVLANAAENIALDYDYLAAKSLKIFNSMKVGHNRLKIRLPLKKFLNQHGAIQSMILRLAFKALKGDTRRLTYQHIKELKDLILSRPYGAIVDLPSRISVSKAKQDIYYKRFRIANENSRLRPISERKMA